MKFIVYLKNIFKITAGKLLPAIKRSFSLRKILNKNYPENQPFSFIQVGAWDGVSNDFLYEFVKKRDAAGVVIEPLPDYFDKLVKNYAFNPAIIPVNKAVHPNLKEAVLFRVDPAIKNGLPDWAGGIASFDPEHHKKSGIPGSVIITQHVPADNLMNIIRDHFKQDNADLLQVDAEGYDYEVLKQVDFSRIKPVLIKFEYMNLEKESISDAIRLLKQNGYYCFYDDIDIIAVNLWKIQL
jgi:FkbM family methyltransferase